MNFGLSSEQADLRSRVIDFAQSELSPISEADDLNGSFARDNWQKCADFGLLGGRIPKEFGGQGWDVITHVVALEALGYACRDNGLTLGVNSLVWTILEPIMAFGNEDQKREFVPKLISGEWIAGDCITEVEAGSDALSMQTSAVKHGDHYALNGEKRYIGFAPIADIFLVMAKTNPDIGSWGISAFLIKSDSDGIERSERNGKMGLRTLPAGSVTLKDCRVSENSRLGGEGIGLSMFNSTMEWERSFILCSHIGAMERQLEVCVEYARERKQYGKNIGSFQSVSNRIADMKLRMETCRLMLYKCAWLKEQGESAALDSALANLLASESILASSMDAVRTFGGKGYMSEFGVERDLRDAVGGIIYAGTSDIQRNLIARMLGL